MNKQVWKWFKAVLFSLAIVSFIKYFVFIPIMIEGNSMSPTLTPGNHVIYESFTSIERFDIILFHDNHGDSYIKRVIGLPGETLTFIDDQLYINSDPVDETYLLGINDDNQVFTPNFTLNSVTGMNTIPEDSYFVLGDNRTRSKDSRMFGFVPKKSIDGKARMIIYPLNELAVLK